MASVPRAPSSAAAKPSTIGQLQSQEFLLPIPTYTELGTLRTCGDAALHLLALELERQGGYIARDIAAEIRNELTARPVKVRFLC